MIVKEAMIVLEETDKYVKYQVNTAIFKNGYPTWEYDDTTPDIVTMFKHPMFNDKKQTT